MSVGTRKKVVYSLLVLAIIWGIYNLTDKKNKQVSCNPPETVQPLVPTAKAASSGKMIPIERKTNAAWGTDPFRVKRHPKDVSRDRPTWRLSGIMYNNQTPLAIINNKPVRTGDTINQAKVVAIQKKTVTLEYKGNLFTLTVAKG